MKIKRIRTRKTKFLRPEKDELFMNRSQRKILIFFISEICLFSSVAISMTIAISYEVLSEFFDFNLFKWIAIIIILVIGAFFSIALFKIDWIEFKTFRKTTKIEIYESIFGGIIGFSLLIGWTLISFSTFIVILSIQLVNILVFTVKIIQLSTFQKTSSPN